MKLNIHNIATRALLAAGLAVGIASAYADGYEVNRAQEPRIHAGMTAHEVRAVLGAPQAVEAYGNQPGPVWTYNVAHADASVADTHTVFEINFSAKGRVIDANEFTTMTESQSD